MNISAAIDFSTADAVIAVGKLDSNEILFTSTKAMTGRDASSMLPWIISQLQKHDCTLDNIRQWTCGTGPGSFTGLRIVASLVAGLAYGKTDIQVRGVPSGTAIAETASGTSSKTAVLYDGRRQELICFSDKFEPIITIKSDNVNQLQDFDNICAMNTEKKGNRANSPTGIIGKSLLP